MRAAEIQALIAGGETQNVEFKGEGRSPLNDRDLVEAVVCLANRPGAEPAWLVIGVEDDGQITGARPRHGTITDVGKVSALVASRTRPSLAVSVAEVSLHGTAILVLTIPAQRGLVGTSDGVFVRRSVGGDGRPSCVPMDPLAMQSMQADRGLVDPSAQEVVGVSWSDLDPLEFDRFRRTVQESRSRGDDALLSLTDLELAKALGVVRVSGATHSITMGGVLLFGREASIGRVLPSHEVAFQVLRGLDVEVNDFFRWPLLRVMEEVESRIRARNREQEMMVGMLRVGVPDYSQRALREALANALIHRDYLRIGAVHFQWHGDRIEISSPGPFPEGVRLENLLVTPPRPRNPLLADAFKRAGIVERTARGIDTIFYEQLRNGRPAPSYSRSDTTSVVVSIPGGEANLNFVRLLVTEAQGGRVLGLDETLILNALWRERSLLTADVAILIQKPEADSRSRLHRLVEAGLVEERGAKKGRSWHLSSAAYRALDDKVGYIRQRGFEPLQQEQMILQYVDRHGRIARKEAAELCRVSPHQAYRLLARLTDEGRLVRHGQKKGSWYERGQIK